jgi:hypothetical protein
MKLQSRHSFLLPDSLLLDSPARAVSSRQVQHRRKSQETIVRGRAKTVCYPNQHGGHCAAASLAISHRQYRFHSTELATAIGRRAGPSKRHRRSDDLGERADVAFGSKIRTLGLSEYAKQQTRSFLRSATSNAPEASHQLNRTHGMRL